MLRDPMPAMDTAGGEVCTTASLEMNGLDTMETFESPERVNISGIEKLDVNSPGFCQVEQIEWNTRGTAGFELRIYRPLDELMNWWKNESVWLMNWWIDEKVQMCYLMNWWIDEKVQVCYFENWWTDEQKWWIDEKRGVCYLMNWWIDEKGGVCYLMNWWIDENMQVCYLMNWWIDELMKVCYWWIDELMNWWKNWWIDEGVLLMNWWIDEIVLFHELMNWWKKWWIDEVCELWIVKLYYWCHSTRSYECQLHALSSLPVWLLYPHSPSLLFSSLFPCSLSACFPSLFLLRSHESTNRIGTASDSLLPKMSKAKFFKKTVLFLLYWRTDIVLIGPTVCEIEKNVFVDKNICILW